jgi:hypothetical protein
VPRSASVLAAAALVAGCGGGHRAASPCPSGRVVAHEPGLVTCEFDNGPGHVRVVRDDLPQAYRRWSRAEVEQWQNSAGWASHPALVPRKLHGVGAGAFWLPGERKLVATDGRRLVTVTVVGAVDSPARVARAAARRSLGPIRLPAPSAGP